MKLPLKGMPPVSPEKLEENRRYAHSLGLPTISGDIHLPRGDLAVVGGGPSIIHKLEVLKAWKTDIWAINGTCRWLQQRGIRSWMYAFDPLPMVAGYALEVPLAVVATQCDPSVFHNLRGKQVLVWDHLPDGTVSGASVATSAPPLAAMLGFQSVTYFGCESSYHDGQTHAYMHEIRDLEMKVACGGREYLTCPDFYLQACELSYIIRAFPSYLKEESGGLLRAMVKNAGEHEITWCNPLLDRMVKKVVQEAA